MPVPDSLIIHSYRRDYSVQFIPDLLPVLRDQIGPRDVVIIDKNIIELYPDIAKCVERHKHHIIQPSESAKTYQELTPLIASLIESGFTKTDKFIAIGGGVIQDITAFIASILLRGVNWIFFPTNLLAQSDSCIGSKTSINFGEYKNQLGGFYPPHAIYINTDFLCTLPEQELRSGVGEMLHYFCVSGRADLDWCKPRLAVALKQGAGWGDLIYRSLSIKKDMIERDEFDQGPRNVFNYGHSFGHALETSTNFSIPHGIAVSFGMDLANIISVTLGLIDMDLRNELRGLYEQVWEQTIVDTLHIPRFFDALSKDKKNEGAQVRVILMRGLGQMFKTTLTLDDAMRLFIGEYFINKLWEKAL